MVMCIFTAMCGVAAIWLLALNILLARLVSHKRKYLALYEKIHVPRDIDNIPDARKAAWSDTYLALNKARLDIRRTEDRIKKIGGRIFL